LELKWLSLIITDLRSQRDKRRGRTACNYRALVTKETRFGLDMCVKRWLGALIKERGRWPLLEATYIKSGYRSSLEIRICGGNYGGVESGKRGIGHM